jgi:hypothetical protein
MRKAIIYKLERQIATVTVKDGELIVEGDEVIKRKIIALKNNYRTSRVLTNDEFLETLPRRLRGQVHCELIDD